MLPQDGTTWCIGCGRRQSLLTLPIKSFGWLIYGSIQRQVRQYLQEHQASIRGNKGETDILTATVVFESFMSVTRLELT